nr:MAG TPA: hypothetical protein [Caudoviricetes sp.]
MTCYDHGSFWIAACDFHRILQSLFIIPHNLVSFRSYNLRNATKNVLIYS